MRHLWHLSLACGLTACTGTPIDAGAHGGSDGGAVPIGDAASDAGYTVLASSIQLTPTKLVSDGTSLFWISNVDPSGGPISSMPVSGGPIRAVVPGPVAAAPGPYGMGPTNFLAVDDTYVYYWASGGFFRAPKDGTGSPALVEDTSDAGSFVTAATSLGGQVYWMVHEQPPGAASTVSVKRFSGPDGSISTVARATPTGACCRSPIGVTATTVFASLDRASGVHSFPLGPDVGTTAEVPGVTDDACSDLISGSDAAYCLTGSIIRLANDGTTAVLAPAFGSYVLASGITGATVAVDDTDVYWLDALPVGTVMKIPHAGGTPSVVASDASPVAIAVDATAVYWSDLAGRVLRLAK